MLTYLNAGFYYKEIVGFINEVIFGNAVITALDETQLYNSWSDLKKLKTILNNSAITGNM